MALTRRAFSASAVAVGGASGLLATPPQDPFILRYMQLCRVSQGPLDRIAPELVDPRFVGVGEGGVWRVEWGPAWDKLQANLALVAGYRLPGQSAPEKLVLVVRGTDVTHDAWGDIKEAFEDLLVLKQKPLPWDPGSPARVAGGALLGLRVLDDLSSGGVGLRAFLRQRLADPAARPKELVITGHSLGGCLATVVAVWLADDFARTGVDTPIRLVTFAAPTAGNAAFANRVAQRFPDSQQYYNTLDVVPNGWSNLVAVKTLYRPHGQQTPTGASLIIDLFAGALGAAGMAYAQPPANRLALAGTHQAGLGWYQQVGAQHHAQAYLRLLGDTSAVIPPLRIRGRHEDATA
ncbi:lipase family protein [Caulobacter sp. RL271]|uniref:Lipase family protein n=1 Tax=Caulobacter segnis TaxID=88688 RepID=A0ABY4ZPK7_9CAUL|nr:lipase family protein [Caulobacter segnis]USQ94564.1 lipase family protein [Caulobacter segnis]